MCGPASCKYSCFLITLSAAIQDSYTRRVLIFSTFTEVACFSYFEITLVLQSWDTLCTPRIDSKAPPLCETGVRVNTATKITTLTALQLNLVGRHYVDSMGIPSQKVGDRIANLEQRHDNSI